MSDVGNDHHLLRDDDRFQRLDCYCTFKESAIAI